MDDIKNNLNAKFLLFGLIYAHIKEDAQQLKSTVCLYSKCFAIWTKISCKTKNQSFKNLCCSESMFEQ